MDYGPIRFVGGPWHNKIVHAGKFSGCWRQIVSIPIYQPRELSFAALERHATRDTYEIADYRLAAVYVNLTARGPVRFWEYHFHGMSDCLAVSSGGDGAVTNWRVPTK